MMNSYAYMFDEDYIIRYSVQKSLLEMVDFHYHSAYEMLFIIDGIKTVVNKDGCYDLIPGSISLFSPNEIHKTSDKQNCTKITFYFTDRYLSKYFTKDAKKKLLRCFENQMMILNDDEKNCLINLCMEAILSADQKEKFYIYMGRILQFLNQISQKKKNDLVNSISNSRISQVLKFIGDNYSKISSIDEIADNFGVTKFHLCRIFREKLNTSVIKYINVIRIQKMCDYLSSEDMSVSECAKKCGFHSSEYAARVFAQIMHISPREYKGMRLL